LRRTLILVLACLITVPSTIESAQTRRRSAPKRTVKKADAEKSSAEVKAGRERVAAQIKTLTYFLYLLGGIAKEVESADKATRNSEASPVTIEQNERNKTKVKESIRNVREGLDKLETDFRSAPQLRNYYKYLAGVTVTSEAAENQAAGNRFDEAGRSLLKAVGQLADALAAMH
jgi:hypothetical protein